MTSETKQCQNCKQEFRVEPDDFAFYDKIKVPPPKLCPDCRQQRRLAHRNRDYFLRTCDKCGKRSISIWHPDVRGYQFYCNTCWWGDGWDAMRYGRDFDFSRPFFEQFDELYRAVPKHMSNSMNNVNSDYIINAHKNKDSYMLDEVDESERCHYGYCLQYCKDCFDCHYINKCEIGYELIKCDNCYNTLFSFNSHNCSDSAFLAHCRGVSNSFFCTNLYNVKNHLFNKPATKEEIARVRKEIFSGSYEKLQEALAQYRKLVTKGLTRPTLGTNMQDSSGNFLVNCKNCKNCYGVDNSINCKYCTDIHYSKDSMDIHIYVSELSYDSLHAGPDAYKNIFSHLCWYCSDITYADECHNSQELFACCGLTANKKHCIFNKQYSREEYYKLKEKITAHMIKTGEWGEYFPVTLSPHGYNHTFAQEFYPLTKEEVLKRGWRWFEDVDVKEKYQVEQGSLGVLPDNINDVDESICKKVFVCEETGKYYRILPAEYEFYKKRGLPLPRLSPQARDHARWEVLKPRKLWQRSCQCAGAQSDNGVQKNTKEHFHGTRHCPNEFETTYAPDRSEIVYCEQCYQSEVL